MINVMIKKLTENPRQWTPILSAISALGTWLISSLLVIVSWFLIRTLNQIDDALRIQSQKIELMSVELHKNDVDTKSRLGMVETELKFLDGRVDRLENRTRVVKNEGNS